MSRLYLLIIIFCASQTMLRAEYCDASYLPYSCRIDLVCIDTHVNYEYILERNKEDCPSEHVLDNEGHIGELYITLKTFTYTDILQFDGNVDTRFISGLSLANNNLENYLYISEFKELTSLDFSHNKIDVAFFHNYYNLISLRELDYSHNRINSFVKPPEGFYLFNNLEILNLSNNNIATIKEGIFNVLIKLKILNLSHNLIDSMTVLAHDLSTELEILNLSYNRIVDVSKGFNTFFNLKELYLDHNKIHEIDRNIFTNNVNLIIMSLTHNMVTNLNYITNLTKLEFIDVSHNLIDTLDEDTFLYNMKLIKFDISSNYISVLPKKLVKGKNLSVFDLTNNKLSGRLENGHFKGLTYVTHLNFSNQQLSSITDYAFDGASRLTSLALNKNKLTILSKHSFKLLSNLKYLDLSDNQLTIIDFDKSDLIHLETLILNNNYISLSANVFAGLKNLKLLNLENNVILSLVTFIFEDLHDIVELSLSNNPINGDIEKYVFSGLVSLPTLHISETNIKCLKNKSFDGMGDLRTINMSHNEIHILEYNCFSNVFNIEILDLSYNFIELFMINNKNFKKLKTIILSNNKLNNILPNSFVNIKSLIKLDISHNEILNIDNNAFIDQNALTFLDLSFNFNLHLNMTCLTLLQSLQELSISGIYNNSKFIQDNNLLRLSITYFHLRNVSALSLNYTKRLIDLSISHNNVSYINSKDFSILPYLEKLDLSYNKLTNIQPGSFKNNVVLRNLNISNNFLRVLNFGIFRGLSSLHLLDLSYNVINKLHSVRFHDIPSLNTIIVDHNNISTIKLEDFISIHLRVLSIGDNPLSCEILASYKHHDNMSITALKLNFELENVHGVTCYKNHNYDEVLKENNDILNTTNFMNDFKDILYNITSRNTFQNISSDDPFKLLNNLSVILDKHFNKTETVLLEYIQRSNQIENNSKNTINVSYAAAGNAMFYNMTQNKDSIKRTNEEIIGDFGRERDPSKFIEVCVALILCVLVCYLLLNLYYNWSMFVHRRRHTMNILPLSETIENQDL